MASSDSIVSIMYNPRVIPITGKRRGVDVAAFAWGCPMGCAIVTPGYLKGRMTFMAQFDGKSIVCHPDAIVCFETSPTSMWEEFNAVNRSVNKGATLTSTTPVLKFLVKVGSARMWVYIDPAKTLMQLDSFVE
jgi:hypothetical protein